MLKKHLLCLLGAAIFILCLGQPGQAQSTPEAPSKKKKCGVLWPVERGDKWGYIDRTGRLVIPFQFDYASAFSEGLAAVTIKEKTGYIDTAGKLTIPAKFDAGFSFAEGLAVVIIAHEEAKKPFWEYGYIDNSGKMVIPLRKAESPKWLGFYAKTLTFSEGLAGAQLGSPKKGKMGYIDKTGRQVIPPKYDHVESFSEGLAVVAIGEKYGYINRSGKMVIPPRFRVAEPFSEGLAPVRIDATENKWGYVDKSGRLVISGKEFAWARGFSEGLAAAGEKMNDKFGFIDKTGEFVIPPQFRRVGDFSEGLAAVELADAGWPGNLAYINQKGEVVIKSMSTFPNNPEKVEYDLHNYCFCGGVARVSLGKKEDEDAEGYINQEGKLIWPEAAPAQKKPN
jgi:hypothetical protein